MWNPDEPHWQDAAKELLRSVKQIDPDGVVYAHVGDRCYYVCTLRPITQAMRSRVEQCQFVQSCGEPEVMGPTFKLSEVDRHDAVQQALNEREFERIKALPKKERKLALEKKQKEIKKKKHYPYRMRVIHIDRSPTVAKSLS